MFAFGYNYNYSYFSNPFGCCNNFMPAMNFCGCNNFFSDLTTSLFLLDRMNNLQSNMLDTFSYSSRNSDQGLFSALQRGQNPNKEYNNFSNFNNNYSSSYYSTPAYNPFESLYQSTSNYTTNKLFSITTPSYKTNNVKRAKVSNNFNTKTNLPQFNDINYNSEKGKTLAVKVSQNAGSKSQKLCARYAKRAIAESGLGQYESGHAYECKDILKRNPNFKEITVSGSELSKLPAGCIIVYDRGDAGYSPKYGHIEITLGDGRAASDFINNRIKPSDKAHVFVPV